MDPCKEQEAQVINHFMIARCLEEQGLKGELGRLAREEGITWNEVSHIRLEFMNILRIDHLWVLPSLTMLSLSNNLIENIENLHMLVNLKELDLSFNKIKQIVNLEELVNLEILNLFNNLIEKIENLETLSQLEIFSIGNNKIYEKDNILCLRRFKKLKSANLAGNPCAEKADSFRTFVATFLPNIVYYEYKMIEDGEREEGNKLYSKKLELLEEEEVVIKEREAKLEAELSEAELHADSFVEFLGSSHLFQQMFEIDTEGKLLLKIGEEATEFYNHYEAQFVNLCQQIFEMGQDMYRTRKLEVDQFMTITEGAKIKNQEESIQHMEDFMLIKRKIFKQISEDKDHFAEKLINMEEYKEKSLVYRQEYFDWITKTWKKLMGIEVTLFEQIEETNQNFEQGLTEMINSFIEMAQGYFAQMRAAQQSYNEMIIEIGLRYLATANIGEIVIPKILLPIFVDRDTFMNAIGASHDLHLLAIDNREDRLIRRAKTWLNNLVNDLQKNEIIRDRAKILEINHYLDIQKEEFEEIVIIHELSTDL